MLEINRGYTTTHGQPGIKIRQTRFYPEGNIKNVFFRIRCLRLCHSKSYYITVRTGIHARTRTHTHTHTPLLLN
jgi:hypothetical protein